MSARRASVVITTALLFVLVASPSYAAAIFNIEFTPTSGTAVDGTITFNNVGDIDPIDWNFQVDFDIYTPANTITSGDWNTLWNIGVPLHVNTALLNQNTDTILQLFTTNQYTSNPILAVGGSGTYTFTTVTPIPEPSTVLLVGLGVFALAIQRRAPRP